MILTQDDTADAQLNSSPDLCQPQPPTLINTAQRASTQLTNANTPSTNQHGQKDQRTRSTPDQHQQMRSTPDQHQQIRSTPDQHQQIRSTPDQQRTAQKNAEIDRLLIESDRLMKQMQYGMDSNGIGLNGVNGMFRDEMDRPCTSSPIQHSRTQENLHTPPSVFRPLSAAELIVLKDAQLTVELADDRLRKLQEEIARMARIYPAPIKRPPKQITPPQTVESPSKTTSGSPPKRPKVVQFQDALNSATSVAEKRALHGLGKDLLKHGQNLQDAEIPQLELRNFLTESERADKQRDLITVPTVRSVICPEAGGLPFRHDPVKRFELYRKEWQKFPAPGEKKRLELRWKVREYMLRQDIPQMNT